jgi:hypothetical protein
VISPTRDEDPAGVVGDERRVDQRHLLDETRLAGDRDPVAEAQGLRECDEQTRAEVRERRAEGETGEQREHGTRCEQSLGNLGGDVVEREDGPDRDRCNEGHDHASREVERRAAAGYGHRVALLEALLVATVGEVERDPHGDDDGNPDRAGDERLRCSVRDLHRFA